MDFTVEEVFETVLDGDEIKQRSTALQVNEDVNIAVWTGRALCDRAEETNPRGAVRRRDPQDLLPVFFDLFRDAH